MAAYPVLGQEYKYWGYPGILLAEGAADESQDAERIPDCPTVGGEAASDVTEYCHQSEQRCHGCHALDDVGYTLDLNRVYGPESSAKECAPYAALAKVFPSTPEQR